MFIKLFILFKLFNTKPSLEIIFNEFKNNNVSLVEIKSKTFYKNLININFLNFKKITLENVSFHYPSTKKNILNNINIEINRNTSIGIIGESGSGKSTFVDIFLGLLQPQKGNFFIDDNKIQKNLKSWQTNIGYVPQFVFLSDDTIRGNIAFGVIDEEIDRTKINESAKIAKIIIISEKLLDLIFKR